MCWRWPVSNTCIISGVSRARSPWAPKAPMATARKPESEASARNVRSTGGSLALGCPGRSAARRAEEREEPTSGDRDLRDRHAAIGQRVLYRVGDRRRRADGAALAHALDPQVVDHRQVVDQLDLDGRQLVSLGDRV